MAEYFKGQGRAGSARPVDFFRFIHAYASIR